MNEAKIDFLLLVTAGLPAFAGMLRYRKADTRYRPFLWYVFISLLNELAVGLVNLYYGYKPVSFQIADMQLFNLFECIILLIQFYCWGRLQKPRNIYMVIMALLILLWISESFIFQGFTSFKNIFLLTYSFVLALLSVSTINDTVVNAHVPINRNAVFIICSGLIILFIYTIIVFTFLLAGIKDKLFLKNIFSIFTYINIVVNVIYTAGILYVPLKAKHTPFH